MKAKVMYILGELVSVAAAGLAMFWAAGRLDWWPAWAVIGVWLAWFAAEDVVTLYIHPQLMAERMHPPKSAKTWDQLLLSSLRLLQLARYIIAGLDLRHGWTAHFPLEAQLAALAVCLLSTALFTWAMASNAYFSQVVRIQAERGHAVVTGGPYRWVRHPSYAGLILFDVALSTLLGSYWAVLIGLACALLLILRTALEDRTLQAELPGYADYARRVRYRLLPGVW